MIPRSVLRWGAAVVVASLLAPPPALAQSRISLIRDAEIEGTIRTYARPLFDAAGLDPEAVQVYLVNDNRINAFVAGGQRLFLNTGLIGRAKSPNQLIGVISHETGHIAGGHLARLQEALAQATTTAIVAMLLGLAAAAAAGDGKAAGAAVLGGTALAERTLLQYNRGQESAADQAGLSYLERTGQSAVGLLDFFELLAQQELLSAVRQDPYLRSHPLTRERMEAVRAHVARSRYSAVKDPPELQARHERMVAKLKGFLQPPGQTLRDYPLSNTSVPARYARAVAYFRIPKLEQAVAEIDGLIAEFPRDPFFHELKGQILYESGQLGPSIPAYREAHKLAPDEALIRTALAQALLDTYDNSILGEAKALLNEALRLEDRNAYVWRLLAIVYGREGNIGMAALALAEQASASNDRKMALQQANRAMQQLPNGSPPWLRAEDIQREARRTPPKD